MLLFYGATRAADTLTLARLDHFIDSYDKTSAFNNHGHGPPKSRFELVTNLPEVTAEYKRVMEARRAAGKEVTHISPYLPTSPHISPYLRISHHISLRISMYPPRSPAQAMPEAGPEKPAHAKGVDSDAEPAAAGTQASSRTS